MRSISGISEAAGQDIIDISRKFLNLLQKIHTFFVDFMNQICIIRISEVGKLQSHTDIALPTDVGDYHNF